MHIIRLLAIAIVGSAALVGNAGGIAKADQTMQGVYTYRQGDVVAEWTIYPSCVPTVGDLRDNLELPVACRLHVAWNPSVLNSSDARLTSNTWAFSVNHTDGLRCPDGTTDKIIENFTFDDVTLTGNRQVTNGPACNGTIEPNLVNSPFTLTFKNPLPIPVEQYPLYCEPGGLKRCF